MADLKISALTSATTPLAGTEVLPVVQSSTTKKTAVSTIKDYILGLANTFTADQTISTGATLTYFNIVNTAGSGNRYSAIALKDNTTQKALFYQNHNDGNLLLRNDTAGGSIGLYTQTAAYGSYLTSAGNHVISDGNLVIGTSGKGIDFSATSGSGTSELLADYEEGTWTPVGTFVTQGSATSSFTGTYTKVGRQVTIVASGSVNKGTASGAFTITGVPYATATTAAVAIRTAGIGAALTVLQANLESGTGTVIKFLLAPQSTSLAGASPTAADMNNPDNYIQLSCTYSI